MVVHALVEAVGFSPVAAWHLIWALAEPVLAWERTGVVLVAIAACGPFERTDQGVLFDHSQALHPHLAHFLQPSCLTSSALHSGQALACLSATILPSLAHAGLLTLEALERAFSLLWSDSMILPFSCQ